MIFNKEVPQERIDEMVADLVKRGRLRQTPEQVKEVMERCHTLVVEDGFLSLDFFQDECHIIYTYVRPGAKLLALFEAVTEDVARFYNCRVIRFLSKRKPESIMRTRPAYRPCSIMYEKELMY